MSWTNLFPSCSTSFEVSEGLRKLQRLHDNPLLLLVVSDFGVPSQGEILPQWVPIEAVISHDPSQIWMVDEEDAEQIVHLALVPVGAVVKRREAGHRRGFVRVRLDADARVVTHGQHVVDDLKSLVAGRVVDGSDVRYLRKLGGCVVFEEGKGRDHARGRDVDCELILPHREPARASAAMSRLCPLE